MVSIKELYNALESLEPSLKEVIIRDYKARYEYAISTVYYEKMSEYDQFNLFLNVIFDVVVSPAKNIDKSFDLLDEMGHEKIDAFSYQGQNNMPRSLKDNLIELVNDFITLVDDFGSLNLADIEQPEILTKEGGSNE